MEISQIMKHQPTINIGMIGSVSNGKSTITGKLTGIKTQKHSDELKKNITIKLGYANTKIFKCPDCPEPQCYQSHHSEIMEAQCKFCDNEYCGLF
jgi:translation initiation factor 2 subunit 3